MKKYGLAFIVLFLVHNFSFVLCMDAPQPLLSPIDRVLLIACENGASLEFALGQGADMYVKDPKNGFTGLHYAAQGGHVETVKRLLKNQDKSTYTRLINGVCKNGMFPFNYAVRKGYDAIVKIIMDYTLEALIRADIPAGEFIKLAQICIGMGADINAQYGCRYFTPLLTMCGLYAKGDIEKVRFLLDSGACIEVVSGRMIPVVTALAHSGNISSPDRLELIKLLIDRGANIDSKGKNGLNLMHHAITLNDEALVDFLIQQKITLCQKDPFGQNEIHYAVRTQNESILKSLLDCGVPMVFPYPGIGTGPLHTAVFMPNENIIEIILANMKKLNIDINAHLDCNGRSALHCASEFGSSSTVKRLLEAGARQFPDKNGMSPLVLCSKNKENKKSIEKLLKGALATQVQSEKQNVKKASSDQHIGENATKKKKTKNKKKKAMVDVVSIALSAPVETPIEIKSQQMDTEIPQIIEKKALDVSCVVKPVVLERVCELSDMRLAIQSPKDTQDNSGKIKTKKRWNINVPNPLSYAAMVMRQGFDLGAQTIRFSDAVGRLTQLHITGGLKPRDISFLEKCNYTNNAHVETKANKKSDLFHATISEEQIKLVLKHGELFDTRKEGRVQCYRMLTTKDTDSKRYNGYTEVSIDTHQKTIIHAFFNKNKNNAIAFS